MSGIVEYLFYLLLLIVIGAMQYFNVVKIYWWQLRIALIVGLFYPAPEFILFYLFGYDYYLCIFFQYNTRGTGLNTYYPEADSFDRLGLAGLTFLAKSKTVTLTMLHSCYLLISFYIIIHLLNLLYRVFTGSIS